MAKSKKVKPSKSPNSVRSNITNIKEEVGSLGSVITALQSQNALVIETNNAIAHNTSQTVVGMNELLDLAFRISTNIFAMANHIVNGKDGTGAVVKVKAGSLTPNTKEQEAEQEAQDKRNESRLQRLAEASNLTVEELKKLNGKFSGGLLDILILGGAALAGFVSGVVSKIISFFKPVMAIIKKAGALIGLTGESFSKVSGGLSKGFTTFLNVFKSIGQFFYKMSGMKAIIDPLVSGGSKLMTFIFTQFSAFVNALKDLGAFFGNLFGKSKGFFSSISKLFTYFDDIFNVLKPVFNVAKALGQTIFKVVPFLGLILSIWDTVSGAIDGFNNTQGSLMDKLIGALKGGLSGFANAIIGGLLDLVKDGVSWVLNQFGFENASKAIDSFSFKDLISKAINGIVEFFMTPVRIIQDLVKTLNGEMSWLDMFKSVMARIVSAILTPVETLANVIGFSPTKKALDMLGLSAPQEGAKPQATSSTGIATKALDKTQDENFVAKDQKEALAAAASGIAAASKSTQQIINTNTQTALIKSKSTNWEPDDQWARGGMAWGA